MYKFISALLISVALSYSAPQTDIPAATEPLEVEETVVIEYGDPNCKTPQLHPDEVIEIIKKTQTKDLNFVALAKAESGFYNHSNHNKLRGIFQIHTGFHKLDDYCSPAEQVTWLERKLDEGAKPSGLFPHTWRLLYS
jgi:hypothetical protein